MKFIIFLLLSSLSFSTLAVDSKLLTRYQSFNNSSKQRLHFLLLRVISDKSLETKYDIAKISRDKVTQNFEQSFEEVFNFFIDHAIAQDSEAPYCHFGGWLSTYNSQEECQAPWKRSVRDKSDLQKYGPTYTSDYSCGGALLFRCNPTLFGPSEAGNPLGECVETNDSQTNEASRDCFDSFRNSPERIKTFFNELESNPEKLAQYLGVVADTIRFCENRNDEFSFCSEIVSFFKEKTLELMACYEQEGLFGFLPEIVTPLNQSELDEIANGLGHNFTNYFEELTRKEQEQREKNLQLYQEAFDSFSQDPRTLAINQRLRNNSTRCLLGACAGSKPATSSKQKCARYVKFGLFPVRGGLSYADQSKPWNEQYPWSSDAVESGPWLEEMGYENAMDIRELSHLTPENAPIGSIIVYEDTTPSRTYNVNGERIGGPGHIEIKTGKSEYISDFITPNPTRIGGARVPIGIYVQIPEEFKTQITTLPGN